MKTYLSVLLLLIGLFSLPATAADNLEIYAAWYGTEQTHVDVIKNTKIVDILKNSIVNNTLMIPQNMNDYFGKDPYPGVVKTLAVQLGYSQGRKGLYNIRQVEGSNLLFPGTFGETYLPAPPDSPVTVNAAWYGIEGNASPSGATADVIRKRMVNGYVYVPADMNTFFGNDPAPQTLKRVAVAVTYKGQNLDLRQVEGNALIFPGQEGVDYLRVFSNVTDAAIKAEFNPQFYLHKNPDVGDVIGNNEPKLWDHYIQYGILEGRDPNPNVSISAMRVRFPVLKQFFGNDYKKYMQYYIGAGGRNGALKSVDPTDTAWLDKGIFSDPRLAFFDPDIYFTNNKQVCSDPNMSFPKVANPCATPRVNLFLNVPALIDHYINIGASANLMPNTIPLGAAQSVSGKEVMRAGDWLGVGDYLISRDRTLIAVMQSDANLAAYKTNDPSKITSGNFAGLYSLEFTDHLAKPDPKDGFFISLGPDGNLCVYKGRNPSDNKGFVYCVGTVGPVGHYFLRLEGGANRNSNLTIRTGDSMFNVQDYVWDFRTNKPGKPGPWDKAFNVIKSVVGCN